MGHKTGSVFPADLQEGRAVMDRPPAPMAERIYCSAWHFLIVGVGVYEYRNHKTWFSKALSVGLIAFHTDGAIADLLGTKPVSRQVLDGVVDIYESRKTSPRRELAPQDRSGLR
jgi:hypothetical protein